MAGQGQLGLNVGIALPRYGNYTFDILVNDSSVKSIEYRVLPLAGEPPGIAVLEEPEIQNLVELAGTRAGPFRPATPGGAAVGVIGLMARYGQGAGASLLIARFSV